MSIHYTNLYTIPDVFMSLWPTIDSVLTLNKFRVTSGILKNVGPRHATEVLQVEHLNFFVTRWQDDLEGRKWHVCTQLTMMDAQETERKIAFCVSIILQGVINLTK